MINDTIGITMHLLYVHNISNNKELYFLILNVVLYLVLTI